MVPRAEQYQARAGDGSIAASVALIRTADKSSFISRPLRFPQPIRKIALYRSRLSSGFRARTHAPARARHGVLFAPNYFAAKQRSGECRRYYPLHTLSAWNAKSYRAEKEI